MKLRCYSTYDCFVLIEIFKFSIFRHWQCIRDTDLYVSFILSNYGCFCKCFETNGYGDVFFNPKYNVSDERVFIQLIDLLRAITDINHFQEDLTTLVI